MDRRTFLQTVGLAGSAVLSGCLDGRVAGDDGEYDVGMSTVTFEPQTITVSAGETVVWRNTSKQGHTVTAYEHLLPPAAPYFASGGFDTEEAARSAWFSGFGGRLAAGETYRHRFDVADEEYSYFCIPHEKAGMTGTVVVE